MLGFFLEGGLLLYLCLDCGCLVSCWCCPYCAVFGPDLHWGGTVVLWVAVVDVSLPVVVDIFILDPADGPVGIFASDQSLPKVL